MSWNIEYVFLIAFTTIISYTSAIIIERSKERLIKRIFLWTSIIASLGVLFFYKYFNLFGQTINSINDFLGINAEVSYISVLLPVGISFYTFQTLGYTIDVYKSKVEAEKHLGIYALYVSFFPQLVAGPIERSSRLLPQFRVNHKLKTENVIKGFKWIIYGFFLKLVVADRLALYVDSVYNNVEYHSGVTFIMATVLFSFQIFGDFAGYSSIAIGSAKLLDIDLMTNFRRPYFAFSIGEFWRRWHISLSTWFRDYFYIPLGGSRVKTYRVYINLLLTFIVSGLWHGASWTFVVWGALHGFYLVIENMFKLGIPKDHKISAFKRVFSALVVFVLATFAWIFFRANSFEDAFFIISSITDLSGNLFLDNELFFYGGLGLIFMLISDLIVERNEDSFITNNRLDGKTMAYYIFLVIFILQIGVFNGGQFIYFQF